MLIKGDIIITDPCYFIKEKDWNERVYGTVGKKGDLFHLGFSSYLISQTYYGDWSCTTFQTNEKNVVEHLNLIEKHLENDEKELLNENDVEIGQFCADSGMVCVVLLDEVLKLKPDFDYHITKPWTTTLIKDFVGEINFHLYTEENRKHNLPENFYKHLSIWGRGNINFYTLQTGL